MGGDQEDICQDLKDTILEFVEDLKNYVLTSEEEKGDLMLVKFFFEKQAPSRTMTHCIKHVLPNKSQIKNKNTSFFKKNLGSIFSGLPSDRVSHYSTKFQHLDKEDKDTIFKYFDTIIGLCELHRKFK